MGKEKRVLIWGSDSGYYVAYDVTSAANRLNFARAVVRSHIEGLEHAFPEPDPPDFKKEDIAGMPESLRKNAEKQLRDYEGALWSKKNEAQPLIKKAQEAIKSGDVERMCDLLAKDADIHISLEGFGGRGQYSVVDVQVAKPGEAIDIRD